MAKRSPPWFVRRDTTLPSYAFFISHVGEDAAEVASLKAEIEAYSGRGGRRPLVCFLDVHNWPIGNVNSGVIREHLLRSSHMVAWVSPAYLATNRGWVWMELAYAELIELSMNLGSFDLRHPYVVPIFREMTVERLERTPWLAYWQRQLLAPNQEHSVTEIARKLVDFYDQEARKHADPEL